MTDLTLTLSGLCLAYDFRAVLLTGEAAPVVAQRLKWEIVARGEVTLTLGVALFDRPFIFTPQRVITERNQTIQDAAVFDWLAEQGYAMPRSEVFGLTARGRPGQIFARDVDIEASPVALCDYGNWVIGLIDIDTALSAALQPLDRPDLPPRFRRALKTYRAGVDAALLDLM